MNGEKYFCGRNGKQRPGEVRITQLLRMKPTDWPRSKEGLQTWGERETFFQRSVSLKIQNYTEREREGEGEGRKRERER